MKSPILELAPLPTVFPLPFKDCSLLLFNDFKMVDIPKNNEWFCRFIKGNLSFIYVKSLVSFVLRTCRPLFIYFGKWLNSFRGFIKVFIVEEMILQKINFEKIKMQTLLTAHTSWSACNRVDVFVIVIQFLATKVKPFMIFEKKSRFWSKNFNEF